MKKQRLFGRFALRIENYFERVRQTLDACLIIQSFNVAYDKRGSHEGFIYGLIWHSTNGHLEEHGKISQLLEVSHDRTEQKNLYPGV